MLLVALKFEDPGMSRGLDVTRLLQGGAKDGGLDVMMFRSCGTGFHFSRLTWKWSGAP